MKLVSIALILIVCAPIFIHAQAPVDYNDVGVIINDNDTNSVAIGNYFILKRNIPARNVIHVTAPTKETINDTEFEALRAQIENYLTTTNLKDSLNYLVTTKGLPHRVDRGGTGGDVNSKSASVDAELMLILGQWSSHIGQATLVIPPNQFRVHPYFRKEERYARKKIITGGSTPYDLYLVTRLIAQTKEEVFSLIDRSGPHTYVNKDSALFVLDQDPTPIDATYNNNMATAAQLLRARNWQVLLNSDSIYVTNQRNVLGYTSWGSNDHFDHKYTQYARPKNSWLPGSIAETYVSTSARNFIPGQVSGQSRIADLIEEGCTGASGYVFEPFTVALSWVNVLFDRYTSGYNLAESYYMSMPTLSWMAIVVGDPKTSIITQIPGKPFPTIANIGTVCQNEVITLNARDALPGNMNWFAADSNAVKAAGLPYDKQHPNWIGTDTVLARLMNAPGKHVFTFVNENFIGIGFAQIEVTVKPALQAGFIISSDTVYLDESPLVQFTDTTENATIWNWDFGDGTGTSILKAPTYTYSSAGKFTVKLVVSNGICNATISKTLIVEATRPAIVLSTSLLAFGDVQTGKSDQRQFTLYNKRNEKLVISAVNVTGSHVSDYTISAKSYPLSLNAQDSATWVVTFAPSDTGARSADIAVFSNASVDPFIVRTTGTGVSTPSSILISAKIPGEFALNQNYPNPFNPGTTIQYSIPERCHVKLKVFTIYGKEIATLVDYTQNPGVYSARFEAGNLVSGIYLYSLNVGKYQLVRRMTLIK